MISVIGLSADFSRAVTSSRTVASSGTRYFVCFANSHTHVKHHRVRSDYLKQGDVFDEFGNRSVRNRQWCGRILAHAANDVGASTAPWSKTELLTTNYALRHNSRSYYVLAPGLEHLAVRRKSISTGTIRSFFLTLGWSDDRLAAIGKADLYIDWSNKRLSMRCPMDTTPSSILLDDTNRIRSYISSVSESAKTKAEASSKIEAFEQKALLMLNTLAHAWYRDVSRYATTYTTTNLAQWKGPSLECDYGLLRSLDYDLMALEPELRHRFTVPELSTHAHEVLEGVNDFTSNGLAYIADLRSIGSSLKTALGVAEAGLNPRSLASLWLSGRFGDRLTIADTKELFTALQKRLHRNSGVTLSRALVTGSTRSLVHAYPITHTRASTILVRSARLETLMGKVDALMRWDVWPTLENTWDLVPFSFVVDWFIPVSDLLGHIDNWVQSPYLKTASQYIGDLVEMEVPAEDVGYRGTLLLKRYQRIPYNVLGDLRPFENLPSVPTFSVVNAVDAVALLVQTA